MDIQGKVISISHAPAIVRENKILKAEIVGLKWMIETQANEIEELNKTVTYLKGVAMLDGVQRKKLKKERQQYLRRMRTSKE